MKKCIAIILFISTVLMGCNKNELIYNAPTNEQITDYVNSHSLDVQDSAWIKDSAIILLEDSLITLNSDQHGKLYEQKSSWGINYSDTMTVGDGNPYVAVIVNNDILSSGADRILITYTDGKSYSRGITEKKGYLIPNTQINEVGNLIIFDNNGKELYKKRE
ncbi:hypothetical protein [Paenibacillus pabuli]|uniref:hypothetical protein n=1 Tax=Paenibacillus pabuli TaxID=1472 RepID=UPI0007849B13|nr:hypothetical protein [Paenibacillus pabuli]MEC0129139.1 hypothetical protein [Paenibacillus pabuli]